MNTEAGRHGDPRRHAERIVRMEAEYEALQSRVEHYERVWADLESRLVAAADHLLEMGKDAPGSMMWDTGRLRAKAEGLRLALSYMRDYAS